MPLNITAKLGMDSKGFKAGAERARQTAGKMRQAISSQFAGVAAGMAGMFAIAAISSQIKETIEWASRIRDLGVQFGVSTQFVQKMDYAFKQTGTDVEFAFKAIRKMTINQSLALQRLTSESAALVKFDAFGKLGISAEQLKAMGPEELFMQIAKNMKDVNAASGDLQDALNVVFGKAGTQLLVTFGSDLAAMSERMEELGLIEDESIQRLGALGDKMEEFKTQNRGVWADIVGGAVKAWTSLVNFVSVSIDLIAKRFVKVQEAWGGVTASLATQFKALKSGDLLTFFDEQENFFKAAKNFAGEAFSNPMENLSEIGAGIIAKDENLADRLKQKEDQQKLNQELQQADNIEKEREKVAAAMDKLQEKAIKRQFDALTPAQQLLALERKVNEEKAKFAKMPKFYSDAQIAAEIKGLGKIEAAEKKAALEEMNLEKAEQQQVLHDAGEAFKKKRDEIAKGHRPAASVAMAGQATFGAMARIGGQMGLKNPVLDTQKKQLLGIEEIKKHSELTANSVRILAGT